ncbi:hypothetical protein BH11ARM2_BH11ARM2_00050 [soil metagenome]
MNLDMARFLLKECCGLEGDKRKIPNRIADGTCKHDHGLFGTMSYIQAALYFFADKPLQMKPKMTLRYNSVHLYHILQKRDRRDAQAPEADGKEI